MSSPLVFSFDLRFADTVAEMWPILSNKEAIAINQQYAGHPGYLVKQWAVPGEEAAAAAAAAKGEGGGGGVGTED